MVVIAYTPLDGEGFDISSHHLSINFSNLFADIGKIQPVLQCFYIGICNGNIGEQKMNVIPLFNLYGSRTMSWIACRQEDLMESRSMDSFLLCNTVQLFIY